MADQMRSRGKARIEKSTDKKRSLSQFKEQIKKKSTDKKVAPKKELPQKAAPVSKKLVKEVKPSK